MKRPLTLYALTSSVAGFDDAIRPEPLADPSLQVRDFPGDPDFGARLYAVPVEPTEPSWADFLREGFPDFETAPSCMARVTLVLQVRIAGAPRFFAATFGSGRFLLRPTAIEKKHGLRVALNAIYAGDRPDSLVVSERLRQVSVTRVAKNTIHTRRQSNRNVAFQDFGIDLTRDLFGAVTGLPVDGNSWGSRISGSDSLRLAVVERFGELRGLCEQLADARARNDYRVRFHAIDDIRTVPEQETEPLVEELLRKITDAPEEVTLAPPTLVDFDTVSRFRFSADAEQSFDDLRLGDYLGLLEPGTEPTADLLRTQKVEALDDQGEAVEKWSVFEALDVELRVGGRTFLLVGGSFYAVSQELMAQLDEFVDAVEESEVVLPDSTFRTVIENGKEKVKEESEGDYNERAANTSDDFLLLDKATVRVDTHADPIEVCDVLTKQRQFVHVKRKFSSSSLSHLFGQGYVSGDLFCASPEYREKIREKTEPGFTELIPAGRPDTSRFEVVYAVIGKWDGAPPSEKLPFFSKINLRRHASDLRALGYQVTYKPIGLVEAP